MNSYHIVDARTDKPLPGEYPTRNAGLRALTQLPTAREQGSWHFRVRKVPPAPFAEDTRPDPASSPFGLRSPLDQLRQLWRDYKARSHLPRGSQKPPRIRIQRQAMSGLWLYQGQPLLRTVASRIVTRERIGQLARRTEYVWLQDVDGVLWKGGAKPGSAWLEATANWEQSLPTRWLADTVAQLARWPK